MTDAERQVRRVFAAFFAFGAGMVALYNFLAGRPVVGAISLVAGAFVLWRSGGMRAVNALAEELTPPAPPPAIPDYERKRCPCCGSPTYDGVVEGPCLLCEWDPEEERDLDAARASFRRHLSVYPPHARPEWSPMPSSEALAIKRELLELYASALVDANPDVNGVWYAIDEKEAELVRALASEDELGLEGEAWLEDEPST